VIAVTCVFIRFALSGKIVDDNPLNKHAA
jgi:hypothetical protein